MFVRGCVCLRVFERLCEVGPEAGGAHGAVFRRPALPAAREEAEVVGRVVVARRRRRSVAGHPQRREVAELGARREGVAAEHQRLPDAVPSILGLGYGLEKCVVEGGGVSFERNIVCRQNKALIFLRCRM